MYIVVNDYATNQTDSSLNSWGSKGPPPEKYTNPKMYLQQQNIGETFSNIIKKTKLRL